MEVSIIIATYNGKEKLQRTFNAIRKLELDGVDGLELIVVDNASMDGTFDFSNQYWVKNSGNIQVITLSESLPGKVNAFELALKNASGKYCLICDDDNSLSENYIQVGVKYLRFYPEIGVIGGCGELAGINNIPNWFPEYAYQFACAPQASQTGNVFPQRNVVYGAGMWFRKALYDEAKRKGFNFIFNFTPRDSNSKGLNFGSEDGELCWAIKYLGYEVWYVKELKFQHYISQERLNQDNYIKLNDQKNKLGPYGALYQRVWVNESNKKVTFFWLKELIYCCIYLIKLLFQIRKPYFRKEWIRTVNNIKVFIKDRNKYDNIYNSILMYKLECIGK